MGCDSKNARNTIIMLIKKVSQIEGIRIMPSKSVSDNRGSFIKFHPLLELEDSLDSVAISFNPKVGTIRGLHFQVEPFAEEKLVACVQGSIFEVFVDLRPNSATLGNWATIELSASNSEQIYLPKGIAHGFQTLIPNSIIHYSLSSAYAPEYSYSIDPFGDLDIDWPLPIPAISDRDANGISLAVASMKYAQSLQNK